MSLGSFHTPWKHHKTLGIEISGIKWVKPFRQNRCPEAVVRRCSVKKVFFKISQNSKENTFARVFFNKAAGLFNQFVPRFNTSFATFPWLYIPATYGNLIPNTLSKLKRFNWQKSIIDKKHSYFSLNRRRMS